MSKIVINGVDGNFGSLVAKYALELMNKEDLVFTAPKEESLKEYKEQWENTMKSENSFVKKLDEPLREEFEKLMDDHFDLTPLEMSDVFAEGFRIGARMMVESLWGKDSNEPEGLL